MTTAPLVEHDWLKQQATGIPGASVAFRATLTATSNEYLKDRLPLEGLVQIGERDVYGRCMRVSFMPDPEPGKGTSFVDAPDADFTFTTKKPPPVVDHWTKRYRAVGTPGMGEYRCVECDVLVGGDQAFSRLTHEEAYHAKKSIEVSGA